jgi:N-acetylneuraminic acid mutarotase
MNKATTNPAGAWARLPALQIARSHPSVACHNGKIYAFGGGGPSFKSLNSVICFDPETGNWSDRQAMPSLRSGTVATTVGDKIYVMGGGFRQEDGNFRFLTAVEIYHPDSDSWEQGPDLLMPHDYPAVALLDNAIYVLGGHHPDATKGGPKTDPGFDFCERLDLEKEAWEQIAPLPTPRFALSAVTRDNRILAMGGVAFRPEGFDNFTVIEIYDPATDTWSSSDEFRLPWPAAGLGSALLGDDLYVFGGYSDVDIHPRTARYDSQQGEWQQVDPLPTPEAAMGVTVCGDSIYTVGGWADDGRTPIDTFYRYTP